MINETQFIILQAVNETTKRGRLANARSIAREVNAIQKKNKLRISPYSTIYENLKRLKEVHEFMSKNTVAFVQFSKPPRRRGTWKITPQGVEYLSKYYQPI